MQQFRVVIKTSNIILLCASYCFRCYIAQITSIPSGITVITMKRRNDSLYVCCGKTTLVYTASVLSLMKNSPKLKIYRLNWRLLKLSNDYCCIWIICLIFYPVLIITILLCNCSNGLWTHAKPLRLLTRLAYKRRLHNCLRSLNICTCVILLFLSVTLFKVPRNVSFLKLLNVRRISDLHSIQYKTMCLG